MAIYTPIISFWIKKTLSNKIKKRANHYKTQDEILKKLILKAKETDFGNNHAFNKINNYTEFNKAIPIRTYEELYPYIRKAKQGKENVLWPGQVKWFAKSSGTTNSASKYIPITYDSLYNCHFKAGKDMIALYHANFKNKNLYKGKGLMLGGSLSEVKEYNYKEGDLSAILLNEFPFWVNHFRFPDIKTALSNNWNKKIDTIINQAIHQNITNITGVPSWMLVILQKILKKTGKNNILEIWPNLELYMHGGINFKPYKNVFQEIIPSKTMNYLEGYNASEGFFAIQDKYDSQGMLLLLDHGIFYEFIPFSDFKENKKNPISLKEVKLKTPYVLVISTNGGLWRYIIGDVIEFCSIIPHRIKIIGRTKSYINTFGEELMVQNTDLALLKTCNTTNCEVKDYTVGPIYINKSSGGHHWLIEFSTKPKDMSLFTDILDSNIKKINSDYAAKRTNDLILKKPKITCIENQEFYNWLIKKKNLSGQTKIPRLSNNRKIIEEILQC